VPESSCGLCVPFHPAMKESFSFRFSRLLLLLLLFLVSAAASFAGLAQLSARAAASYPAATATAAAASKKKVPSTTVQDDRVSRVPPRARHSTERLEEPGRHRNYGTEYTKPKKQQHHDEQEENKGRKWTFGKVPWW